LRFGFDENKFAAANGNLADYAAFVGLPCVGLAFLPKVKTLKLNASNTTIVIVLGCIEALTRGLHPERRDSIKVLVNLLFFVAPVALVSVQEANLLSLGGIILFVVAGLVITADRNRSIAGVRCENWFHYCIGVAAYLIAQGL
jgi:hypothetical protein